MGPNRLAAAQTAAAFIGLYGVMGAYLPFWPLWFRDWGLSAAEVGSYAAVGMASRVVAGMVLPILADRLEAQRRVVVVACIILAGLYALHGLIETRPVLLLATVIAVGLTSGTYPIVEALGATAARRHGFDFARARGAGSAAFLGASIGVGFAVAAWGIDAARWAIVIGLLFSALAVARHPGGTRGPGPALPRPKLADIARLFRHPVIILFALTVSISQSSHAVLYAYASVHWRELGMDEALIGQLWAVSIVAEVALMMLIGTRLVARVGPLGAIAIGTGAGILRWLWMAFDPTGAALLLLQTLHALTFAMTHLGMIAFISDRLPPSLAGSTQGLVMSFGGGLFTALGMFVAARFYNMYGGQTYLIGAILSVTAMLLLLALVRMLHRTGQTGNGQIDLR